MNAGSYNRIKVDRSTRDKLRDWKWLAADITTRPTSIAEVVRHPLSIWQATNAAKAGMGGVIFDLTKQAEPIVWRQLFPADMQSRWVSNVPLRVDITNPARLDVGREPLALDDRLHLFCQIKTTPPIPALAALVAC